MALGLGLSQAERDYLATQRLGRLATVAENGQPQNNPVGFFVNEELGVIDIGGAAMGQTKPSCWPSTPRNTGSSTTRSGRMRPSPGTGRRRCTWAWPTEDPDPFKPKKSCQLLDAGHRERVKK